jgi:hypothetical protein
LAVLHLRDLSAPQHASLDTLLERANAASDHPPLPEPQQLAVSHPAEAPDGERIVAARPGTELDGVALLSPARDGSTVVHLVVDPSVPAAAEL